jgi:hypothetical protein
MKRASLPSIHEMTIEADVHTDTFVTGAERSTQFMSTQSQSEHVADVQQATGQHMNLLIYFLFWF